MVFEELVPEESTEQETKLAEIMKTLTRPTIALAFVGMFIGALFTGRVDEIPDWLRWLGSISIVWWFGDRSLNKILHNGGD